MYANEADTTAPYSYDWTDVSAGTYSITAVATDNNNATTSSTAMNVTVGTAPVGKQVYYIHTDHLNTPRLIEDQNQATVWQWDNDDPFGNNIPSADPNNTGTAFVYNHRFSGQYYDVETQTHYNYFRDYDPSTGRYLQSDPIGLAGGINTYGYANSNAMMYVDPTGEDFKEQWDAMWEVGPVDAYNASTKDTDLARKYSNQARYKDKDGETRPLPGDGHGAKNAYTHCVWVCAMAQRLGHDDAKKLGELHEEAGQRSGNAGFDKKMDLYNNAVGCGIGAKYPNDKHACPDKCLSKLLNGELREVKGLGKNSEFDLIPTDVHRYPVNGAR